MGKEVGRFGGTCGEPYSGFRIRGATNIFQSRTNTKAQQVSKGLPSLGLLTGRPWKAIRPIKNTPFISLQNSGLQQIEIVSNRNDRYAQDIIERLVNSFNFNNDVQ